MIADGPAAAGAADQTGSAWVATPFGAIRLHWRDACLTGLDLTADTPDVTDAPDAPDVAAPPDQPPPAWLADEIAAYLTDPRHRPACPTAVGGTPFQRRVWALIAAIPPGQTRTYSALAADLGSAPRAVGGACRANPVPLVVPCHRVVARQGLGGFAGARGGRLLTIKRWLLAHEGALPGA